MSTQQQIEQQINEDFQKFYNSIYNGKVKVPDNIIELFKTAVMNLAPHFHQVHASKIQSIASKKANELHNGDITDVIKIVINTPLKKLYKDFDEAVEAQIKLDKFILSYNEYVNDFSKNLQMKKANLLNISNTRGNGLKIIN